MKLPFLTVLISVLIPIFLVLTSWVRERKIEERIKDRNVALVTYFTFLPKSYLAKNEREGKRVVRKFLLEGR